MTRAASLMAGVAATLARTRRIAAVPLQRRRAQGPLRGLWFTIVFALFVPAGLLVGSLWNRPMAIASVVALAVMGSLLALGWWVSFVSGVAAQAALPSSRLVPGHARHLGLALWIVAASLSTLVGGLFAVAGLGFVVAAIAAFTGLALLTGAMRVDVRSILPVPLIVFALSRLRVGDGFLAAAMPVLRAHGTAVLVGAALASAGLFAVLGRTVGGTRASVAGLLVRGAEASRPAPTAARRIDATMTEALPSAPWLRALSMLRLDVRLGGPFRGLRARTLLSGLSVVLTAVAGAALASWADVAFSALGLVAMWLLAGLALAPGWTLDTTRREQQLVALLPGLPPGARASRALSGRLTAVFVAGALAATVVLALLAAVLGRLGAPLTWRESAASVAAVPLSCVPLATALWRPWSRASAPGGIVLFLLLPPALWGFALLVHAAGVPMPAIALACIGATAAWCAHRWREMAREAAPLPVGRLG